MTLPQCAPKDSPAFQRWYQALRDGQRDGYHPTFAPRACSVDGVPFIPKVGNQVRCPACIAAHRWRLA